MSFVVARHVEVLDFKSRTASTTANDNVLSAFSSQAWYGLVAPPKTPNHIIQKLHAATVKVLAMPEVRERLQQSGADPVGNTLAEHAAEIKAELEKMKNLATSAVSGWTARKPADLFVCNAAAVMAAAFFLQEQGSRSGFVDVGATSLPRFTVL